MSDKQRIIIPNQKTALNDVWMEVERFCERNQIFPSDRHKVELALDEILANIIQYGYPDQAHHDIEITFQIIDDNHWIIQIKDDGIPFDPTAAADPNIHLELAERPIGGLGIHLVKSLFQSVEYEREENHNVLKITHHIRSLL